uniref:Chromo domain-containing protein n=1 Tax=Parastrongyloides trichosuri TaxID=131310 RepID=A0A0N4ZQW3_PARTI
MSRRKSKKDKKGSSQKNMKNKNNFSTVESDDEIVYDIEDIIDCKVSKTGERTFLVKWKGYGHEENTWEPISSFTSHKAINDFLFKKTISGKNFSTTSTTGITLQPLTFWDFVKNKEKKCSN